MKTLSGRLRRGPGRILRAVLVIWVWALAGAARAVLPPPGTPPPGLWCSWSFFNTNTWVSDSGVAPVAFTNVTGCQLGDGTALVVDSPNPALLRYNVTEANAATNLSVNTGTLMGWFAPDWSGTNVGGTGPGQWGRLIEVGAYTTNASFGWWSLYVDPDGVNIYFSAQTNSGGQATYLTAPIAWTSNRWHQIALTYSATNSALYLDGALVTNGLGVTYWPGPEVLADGFGIGSDSNGLTQARAMFDDLSTWNYPLDAGTISATFEIYSLYYYGNPLNPANLFSAQSYPTNTPSYNAIAGPGSLVLVSSNVSGCVTSGDVWLTNVVATVASNGAVNLQFTIAGGSNSAALAYDVFASTVLGALGSTNLTWAWMGQGYSCNTYLLTNLPNSSVYLILGTPIDSDRDGLTDAYELLVSHTDPHNWDTDGDGISDSDEVLLHLNPLVPNPAVPPGPLLIPSCPQ